MHRAVLDPTCDVPSNRSLGGPRKKVDGVLPFADSVQALSTPAVHYARTDDGIDVAYSIAGRGPRDVVVVHGFTTHLDLIREMPWHMTWSRRLDEHFRVITFDKRGTGLSDRSLGFGSIEDRTRDLVAVMDASGSERASLVGISEGAPMSLVMAAIYPERVERVVIYGGYARMALSSEYPQGIPSDLFESFLELMRERWGTGMVFSRFFIHSPDGQRAAMAQFERNACTRQMAEQILRANYQVDVQPFLPSIVAPTLVIHNAGDPMLPAACGRVIADVVPGAKYLEFEGDYHCTGYVERALPRVDAAVEFLLGGDASRSASTSTRGLATILFTDIVESTQRASEVGDAAWRELLDQHDIRSRGCIERFGGRLVQTTGDGILALFDGPSRGIDCARAIGEAIDLLGVRIRAGLHTGEIEHRGTDVGGIGVHVAARVAALAGAGEVLVSRTVRDLTLGSSLALEERGSYQLKGVPGSWELFAVAR